MIVYYLRNDCEVDAERCRFALREKSPVALSTVDGTGRVAHVTGFVQSIEFDADRAVGMRWRVAIDVLTIASTSLVSPEVFESIWSQRCVDGRAGDRPVPEPSLDSPGVMPLVGEGVAAGVTEHVRVRLELETGPDRDPLDHAGKAGRCERRAALAHGRCAFALKPSQGS
jgi:hypothetical protein